jgi:hypothetical protein
VPITKIVLILFETPARPLLLSGTIGVPAIDAGPIDLEKRKRTTK